ncbi:MAG: hypothetical protein AAF500_14895 [Myxococcota bacterium]
MTKFKHSWAACVAISLIVGCGSDGTTDGTASLNLVADDPGALLSTVVYDIVCGAGESIQDELEAVGNTLPLEWEALVDLPLGDCSAVLVGIGDDGLPICSSIAEFTVEEGVLTEPDLGLDCTDVGGSGGTGISVETDVSIGSGQFNSCDVNVIVLDRPSDRRGSDGDISVTVNVDRMCTQDALGDEADGE